MYDAGSKTGNLLSKGRGGQEVLKEKAISVALTVLVILFIPIFLTTMIRGPFKEKDEEQQNLIKIDYGTGVQEIPLEQYLIGVVAAEMPISFELEAFKAQAIAARTYTLKRLKDNPNTIFTQEIQSYYSNSELEKLWDVKEYAINYAKVVNAVNSTKGLVVTYNDELIDAIFHSTSIGVTRSAQEVWGQDIPYLQSVDSLDDINAPTYLHQYTLSYDEFIRKAKAYQEDIIIGENISGEIQIIERTKDGFVQQIQLGNKILTGENFRKIYDLASSHFTLNFRVDNIEILCKGYGHCVGMSQYGADFMAKSGYKYEEILKHYYTGVQIKQMNN